MKSNDQQSIESRLDTSSLVSTQCEIPVGTHFSPDILKDLVESSSPLAYFLLLCWFFQILTNFIKVCHQD